MNQLVSIFSATDSVLSSITKGRGEEDKKWLVRGHGLGRVGEEPATILLNTVSGDLTYRRVLWRARPPGLRMSIF